MDLTQLEHTITAPDGTETIIDEPVGFDELKLRLVRSDYHGVSAEATVSDLEFYGRAAGIIREAYLTSIETELTYRVTETGTGAELYSGIIDLTTYKETRGNYFSVKVSPGEIGAKTTFNNRTETEVGLFGTETAGGRPFTNDSLFLQTVEMPAKSLFYTNHVEADTPQGPVWNAETSPTGRSSVGRRYTFIPIQINSAENAGHTEIGTFGSVVYDTANEIGASNGWDNGPAAVGDYYNPFFEMTRAESVEKGVSYAVSVDVAVRLAVTFHPRLTHTVHFSVVLCSGEATHAGLRALSDAHILAHSADYVSSVAPVVAGGGPGNNLPVACNLKLTATATGCRQERLFLGIIMDMGSAAEAAEIEVEIQRGSIRMDIESRVEAVSTCRAAMVRDVLDTVVQLCSDKALRLKSDYYAVPTNLTILQPAGQATGPGALKAIVTGAEMRGAGRLPDGTDRPVTVTFKRMIENLAAMDCVGWGFEQDAAEPSGLAVRVEPWEYFYRQAAPLMEIDDAREVTRSADQNAVTTRLKCGYSRASSPDVFEIAQTVHGSAVWDTAATALTRERDIECGFVADPVLIETIRRKGLAEKSGAADESTDDSLIVLEMKRDSATGALSVAVGAVLDTVLDTGRLMGRLAEAYNVRITPRRCLSRWAGILAGARLGLDFRRTSSKFPVGAALRPAPVAARAETLAGADSALCEDAPLGCSSYQGRRLMAETVKLTYPITLAQYAALKADPYAPIRVSGTDYWLKEIIYPVRTGLAEMTLVPVEDNQ